MGHPSLHHSHYGEGFRKLGMGTLPVRQLDRAESAVALLIPPAALQLPPRTAGLVSQPRAQTGSLEWRHFSTAKANPAGGAVLSVRAAAAAAGAAAGAGGISAAAAAHAGW